MITAQRSADWKSFTQLTFTFAAFSTFASSDEDVMAYSGKAGLLSRSQMSSNCSTTGSSSSRGSTGSRGLRKHSEVQQSFSKGFKISLPRSLFSSNGFNN